jgi:hypothetical protein
VIIRVVRFALLAGALALAGCTDAAGEPSTLPDVTAAPSRTPTPTASPAAESPVEPDNAHEYTAEGVETFTLYAIEVINYAYRTNDVTYLEQIMTPNCQTCANTVTRLNTIREAGGRIEGGQMTPGMISVSGPTKGVQTSAGVDLRVSASRTIDGDGQVTNTETDREVYFVFNLAWEDNTWKLDEVLQSSDSSS